MKDHRKIAGRIVSGIKQGAFFTQLDWVQEQCLEKLGFKPFPGTLNLEIPDENMTIIEALQPQEGMELVPPTLNFCSGFVFPITIEGIYGAIVAPAADVWVHGKNIIEIIQTRLTVISLRHLKHSPKTVIPRPCFLHYV